ncbi:MAG TPA: AI-2E family transporter [Xanthobacteraceae bacterium]|nr:AI-2E family transporter [Xanthobacteraceae bacterium]
MSNEAPVMNDTRLGRFIQVLVAVILVSAALYFARVVFEPIAFALFGMALVWPFQKAMEAKMPKPNALILTILLTLFVIFVLALAIIWSVGDIVHWIFANVARFQSLYMRTTQWLEGYDIFVTDGLGQYDVRTFIGIVQGAATSVNYFIGFCVVIFLLLTFGLVELSDFRLRLEELEPKIDFNISQTAEKIAMKVRKYMLIRTMASVLTGLAVFAFALSIGLDLAVAWGVISFVLNYIPYIGPFVAVLFPVIFAAAQFESWPMAVVIFGGLYTIQFLIGNYLEPMIAGKALAISPLVMLVAFFFWAFLWGIPGAFIGLPVTIALFTICEQNPSSRWIARLLSTSGAALVD